MGGLGSGWHRARRRRTTNQFHTLDCKDVVRSGVFSVLTDTAAPSCNCRMDLEVASQEDVTLVRVWTTDETEISDDSCDHSLPRDQWLSEVSMFIRLTATEPYFGGTRFWFICPRSGCSRRCRILYREQRTNARAFACRTCNRLVYETQGLSKIDRVARTADHIASQLRVDAWGTVSRPKRMRLSKYEHLLERLQALDSITKQVTEERMARLIRSLSL
jgi:hypothetical protein